MKHYPIEDTIIAYFDGRLSDDESAELLHRVSVSPEIRSIFREHERLRAIAKTAARNVAVRPEIESAVFANIAALQDEERKGAAPLPEVPQRASVAMRRTTLAAALLALLLAGSALYFELAKTNTSPATRNAPIASSSSLAANSTASVPNTVAASTNGAQSVSAAADSRNVSSSPQSIALRGVRTSSSANGANPIHRTSSTQLSTSATDNTSAPFSSATWQADEQISAVVPMNAEAVSIREPERSLYTKFQPTDIGESFDRFELGLESSTGFNSPADQGNIQPFGDQRVHLGYFLSAHDQLGLRLTYGEFQTLQESRNGMSGVYSSVDRTNVATMQLAKEIYYLHRLDLPGGLMLDGSAGGGLLNNGWLATLELGLKIPLSAQIQFATSFSLSRVHSNAPTAQDLMEEEASMPVILSGSDVHNTLNGRLHYGLSYRF
jgi:hypothetical protein